MSRIAYVNGRYLPRDAAKVAVEDRGYQFADGVYEVCEVRGGRIIDQRRKPHWRSSSAKRSGATEFAMASSMFRSPVGWRGGISRFPRQVRDRLLWLPRATATSSLSRTLRPKG